MNYKIISLITILTLTFFSTLSHANGYLLGSGDLIQIDVIKQPDLSQTQPLNESGEIRFPYIGVINLSNKTTFQAEELLEERLGRSNYVKSPQVTLRILEHHSNVVSVDGLVSKPGEYPIIGVVSVEKLVTRAGGILADASSEITFFRKGQPAKKLDLYGIYDSNNLNQDTIVKPGDRILVSSVPVFYTYGEVQKPGRYKYEKGMSVYQALSISAGLTDEGSEKNITIIRNAKPVDVSLDDQILPNDVIKIRKSLF